MRMVIKRLFDFTAALIGLVLLSPVLVLIGLVLWLHSSGPIFYRANRIGKDGHPFAMYKFRTMIVDADRHGPLVTAGDDPRVTRVGRILRLTKLDELPTLWNVLIGDMSLVGPRPENPKLAALYNEEQRRVWLVRPGVTGLATVRYRHEEALLAGVEDLEAKYFEIMQDKLRLELEYIKRQSFMLDITILWRTMLAIFKLEVPNA
jgi:lipopolysaccharide/colanic/teichoic acid biosynthesis glycosyltransferase